MRRIKAWLRSSISENSLNHRMFATVHKGRIDAEQSKNIAEEFATFCNNILLLGSLLLFFTYNFKFSLIF